MSFKSRALFVLILASAGGYQSAAEAQNLRELARQHASQGHVKPLEHPAPPADLLPKSIEQLTKEADLVVQARLARIESYLGPKEDRVLTDYRMLQPQVIAGALPTPTALKPGPGAPLVLTVVGGELVVEGVLVRGTDNNRDAIREGALYLLFLRASVADQPGRYEIHHGGIFEVSRDKADPLLKAGDRVFKGVEDSNLQDIVTRVRQADRARVR